jgi:Zn finger protein HypA/HybF involved in hydrogenase expression
MKKKTSYTCRHCKHEFPFKGHTYGHIYCNLDCQTAYLKAQAEIRFNERYAKWLNNEDLGLKNPRPLIRKFVLKRDGDKCDVCNITEWNKMPITLWCDHIDGNASNNHPSNFQMVCPNCDSQSPTFGGKNLGNGRKSRGMPQYG